MNSKPELKYTHEEYQALCDRLNKLGWQELCLDAGIDPSRRIIERTETHFVIKGY